MSFVFSQPLADPMATPARGIADLGDILDAEREAQVYARNWNSEQLALEEAFDRRNDAIRAATGVQLDNPLRSIPPASVGPLAPLENRRRDEVMAESRTAWSRKVAELEKQFPQIRNTRPIEEDAFAIAREAEARAGNLTESRPGLGKYAAAFGGGLLGSLRDPLQTSLLLFGAGPGATRTIAGAVVRTAAQETIINAAGEAAIQPRLQAWREEAGLPAGWEEGVRNVLMAGAFGGVLGAGAGAITGTVRAVRNRAAPLVAEALPAGSPAQRAMMGEAEASEAVLRPLRDTLSPMARGALDALEGDRLTLRAGFSHLDNDLHLSAAFRAAEDPRFIPELIERSGYAGLMGRSGEVTPQGLPRWLQEAQEPLSGLRAPQGPDRAARKSDAALERQARKAERQAEETRAQLAEVEGRILPERQFAAMQKQVDEAAATLFQADFDATVTPKRRAAAVKRAQKVFDEIGPVYNDQLTIRAAAADLREKASRLDAGVRDRQSPGARFRFPDSRLAALPASRPPFLARLSPALVPVPEPGPAMRPAVERMAIAQADLDIEVPIGVSIGEDGAPAVVTKSLSEAVSEARRSADLARLVEACRVAP